MKSETVSAESFTGLDDICYVNLHQRYIKVVDIIRIFKTKIIYIIYFLQILLFCVYLVYVTSTNINIEFSKFFKTKSS